MALVKIDVQRRRWMITPANIIERSALLRLPARKWMTTMNMFIIPESPANARALIEELNKDQLGRLEGEVDSLNERLEVLTAPARTDRVWPAWYQFNTKHFSPLEHQVEALKRLYPVNSNALLMEMGTAKTRVLIDLYTAHFYEQRIKFVIVIAPMTVKVGAWPEQLEMFSPCPFNFIDVDSDYRAASLRLSQDRLTWLVVGTESLSQGRTFSALEPVTRLGVPFACVVDESTRIANHKAICTQASYELRRRASLRSIATGFEIKKNVVDLYSQFEFLDPNIIGVHDYIAFRNRYCIMGGYKNKEIVGYNRVDELMGLVAPHAFQCDKSVLKLPPKLYEKRIIKLTPEQRKVYQAMKKGDIERVSVENVLTRTLRLQQITSGFYNTDGIRKDPNTGKKIKIPVETIEVVPPSSNPKLRELVQVAKEISHPMIVWAESLYEIGIIEAALSKHGKVLKIIGDTPKEERRGIINEFQSGRVPFLVGTASAGGIGITLTAARTVVYFSNNQRLEYRVQSEDRAHRTGQTGSVTIIDLAAAGTVDISLLATHREKIELATYVKMALKDKIGADAERIIQDLMDGKVDTEALEQARGLTQN